MNRHALDALEFDRVLDLVAGYATSDLGAEAVRAREPTAEEHAVATSLDQVDEMVSWLIRDESWAPPLIPDVRGPLHRLATLGSVLSESEFVGVLGLLVAARAVRSAMLPQSSQFARLAALAGALLKDERRR
jgi:DNA mismatch repair protein MutS2